MPKYDKKQYILPEVYKHYKNSVDNPVDYKTHKKILDTWGEVVRDYIVAGKDVQFHQRLSLIGVRKFISRTYTDYEATKRTGKLVRKPNSHSGYYGARVYWNSHNTRINVKGWTFKACRKLSSAVGKVLLTPYGHTTYVMRASIYNTRASHARKTKLHGL